MCQNIIKQLKNCLKYVKKNPNENPNSQINIEPRFTLNNNNPNSGFI